MDDNRKTEQVLRDSEIKYKALYDSSRDAIMIIIPDKGFINGNKSAVEMFGCRNEAEFKSLTPAALSPKYQPDGELSSVKSQQMMKTAMEKGSHFFEWRHKRINGEEFPATVLLSSVDLGGRKLIQATVRDITDYKKIEEELKETAAEWDRTFNAISDSIFIQDKNHTIIRVNKAFADLMHAKPEDLIGKKCYELLHGLKSPWPNCPAEKTKIDKISHTEEVNDPNIGIPLLVSTSPILDKSGEFIGVIHVSRDISMYKKAEKERAQLAAIVESSDDAIIGKSLDGIIFSWNKAAEKMYGYAKEEIVGRRVSIVVPPDHLDEFKEINEKIKRGESVRHFETLRVRKDGQRFNVSLTLSPIKDSAGSIIGVSTIARDITERKQAEEELAKKMRTLERFQKITVGRELRMKELKTEIARLKSESGEKIG